MTSQSFEHLIVWQKAHQFVLAIYRITKSYPELYYPLKRPGLHHSPGKGEFI